MEHFTKDQDTLAVEICKVDESLGIIFGFAMVTKVNGEEHIDTQDDAIDEFGLIEATADFMLTKRTGCIMHERDDDGGVVNGGDVIFAFPLTSDIAKALKIESPRHGLLIGFRPNDPEELQKAKRGEYTGFSIGGARIEDEEIS